MFAFKIDLRRYSSGKKVVLIGEMRVVGSGG
jgi:hypothetical protein